MNKRTNELVFFKLGGAVAVWQALLSGDKINENQKDLGFAPRPGQKKEKKGPINLYADFFC